MNALTMTTPVAADPSALLELMLSDMAGQPELFQPTEFWRAASARIAEELRRGGFENFRRLAGPRDFFVPSYGPPGNFLTLEEVDQILTAMLPTAPSGSKKHQTLVEMLSGRAWALADYRVFLAGDRPEIAPDLGGISESTIGNPPDQLEVDSRRFSRSMLNYLHGLVFIKQVLGETGFRTVLEIGGGFGTLGEILHQSGGGYAYVDVDIPPTSAVASHYLSRIPGLDLIDYEETRADASIPVPAPGRQMVICPWQLPRLTGRIDLAWNYISFQEMEPDVVRFYLDQVRRLGARHVLLRNLREGKQKRSAQSPLGVVQPILGSDYDAFLPGYRLAATNVLPFGYRTIDGFHSELRLYERE
jgi:putative sugar O-methyltransferase